MPDRIYTNREVSEALQGMADLMKLKDENRFRIAAIEKAANQIVALESGIADAVAQNRLEDIEGVGKGIAREIQTLFAQGQMETYATLRREFPEGLVEVMRLPGVGPRKAITLWKDIGITTVDELFSVIQQKKLRTLKGFTARSEAILLAAIETMRSDERSADPIGFVLPHTERFLAHLRAATDEKNVPRLALTGELRQWKETITIAQILVQTNAPDTVVDIARELPEVARISARSESSCKVTLHAGIDVDMLFTTSTGWWFDLVHTTGDEFFWASLLEHGRTLGLRAVSGGWTKPGTVEDASTSEPAEIDVSDEIGFLAQLGIPYLAPEQRTKLGTPTLLAPRQAKDLLDSCDLRGELHAHTNYSDGRNSLEEMAQAAKHRGYSYWGVTDHGLGHGFGDSLDGKLLAQQAVEIEALNHEFAEEGLDFRLLKGIEAEILADGSLGLEDDVLSRLDVVVASIHSSLRQDADTITARCLRAIHNPYVNILGHPTSRLLGSRPPTALDVPRILRACQQTGTAVEINCNPARLDLNDQYTRMAADAGCLLVLNCDAHSIDDLDVMRYGMGVARRAGLEPTNVLNTRPLDEVLEFCRAKSAVSPV